VKYLTLTKSPSLCLRAFVREFSTSMPPRCPNFIAQRRKGTKGFGNAAVRDSEQGRRQPKCAARILLAMIAEELEKMQRVMGGFEDLAFS
jgi:hypothetical protein